MSEEENVIEAGILNFEASKPEFMVQFFNEESEEIARIGPDGTVTLSYEGADKKAAKVFWESMQVEGKSLFKQVAELTEERDSLLAENEMLRNQIEDND